MMSTGSQFFGRFTGLDCCTILILIVDNIIASIFRERNFTNT